MRGNIKMKWKMIVFAIVISMALFSCGRTIDEDDWTIRDYSEITGDHRNGWGYVDEDAPQEELEDEEALDEEVEEELPIEWTTALMTGTDADGYKYNIWFKFSPWILYSNTKMIKSAWKEIGGDTQLPDYDSWHIESVGSGYQRKAKSIGGFDSWMATNGYGLTDMYYCMGVMEIRNTTSGWSITQDNNRSLSFSLELKEDLTDITSKDCYVYGGCRSKIFFTSGTSEYVGGMAFSPLMVSDKWGPIPFVCMLPENIAPNTPANGGFYDFIKDRCCFSLFKTSLSGTEFEEVSLGIVGKDGVFRKAGE